MSETVLLVHAGATWFMVGLIWFVQIVHYPLFSSVSGKEWIGYEARHQRRTTIVVLPVMLIEAITAVTLALGVWGGPIPGMWPWLGVVLLAIIWISTFAVQVPLHAKLAQRHSFPSIRRLVMSNWVRTIAWSGRGIVALVLVR